MDCIPLPISFFLLFEGLLIIVHEQVAVGVQPHAQIGLVSCPQRVVEVLAVLCQCFERGFLGCTIAAAFTFDFRAE